MGFGLLICCFVGILMCLTSILAFITINKNYRNEEIIRERKTFFISVNLGNEIIH